MFHTLEYIEIINEWITYLKILFAVITLSASSLVSQQIIYKTGRIQRDIFDASLKKILFKPYSKFSKELF